MVSQIAINDKTEETERLKEYIIMEREKLEEAKKTFDDNGCKWGKKLKKKLFVQADVSDISYVIKNLYINVHDVDYIEMTNDYLLWHLGKEGNGAVNESFGKFCPRFYDIKAAWLDSFIRNFTPQYTVGFEKKTEDDSEIVTGIELKWEVS